jgi:hypothetical protein
MRAARMLRAGVRVFILRDQAHDCFASATSCAAAGSGVACHNVFPTGGVPAGRTVSTARPRIFPEAAAALGVALFSGDPKDAAVLAFGKEADNAEVGGNFSTRRVVSPWAALARRNIFCPTGCPHSPASIVENVASHPVAATPCGGAAKTRRVRTGHHHALCLHAAPQTPTRTNQPSRLINATRCPTLA